MVGTGGHARMMWALWQELPKPKAEIVGWLEHKHYGGPFEFEGLPVFTETETGLAQLKAQGITAFYFGLGKVTPRPDRWENYQTLLTCGLTPLTLIHPSAVVAKAHDVEAGCFIGANVVIQPFSHVEAACIINTGAVIEHDCVVKHNTHVGPNATLCGNVTVGEHCMIGAGSVIIQGKSIGSSTTVGAGAVVLSDLDNNVTAVGNPAQVKAPLQH